MIYNYKCKKEHLPSSGQLHHRCANCVRLNGIHVRTCKWQSNRCGKSCSILHLLDPCCVAKWRHAIDPSLKCSKLNRQVVQALGSESRDTALLHRTTFRFRHMCESVTNLPIGNWRCSCILPRFQRELYRLDIGWHRWQYREAVRNQHLTIIESINVTFLNI